MHLAEWVADFRALHDKAKSSWLSPGDKEKYCDAREELAAMLIAVQRLQAKPGQTPREVLRVSRALQADLELESAETLRVVTLEVSAGGFGALLPDAPAQGTRAKVSLRLPDGDRIEGLARVVGSVPAAGSARVSFAFENLGRDDVERLELDIFDTALAQLSI